MSLRWQFDGEIDGDNDERELVEEAEGERPDGPRSLDLA